jgi:hypothetical protein
MVEQPSELHLVPISTIQGIDLSINTQEHRPQEAVGRYSCGIYTFLSNHGFSPYLLKIGNSSCSGIGLLRICFSLASLN